MQTVNAGVAKTIDDVIALDLDVRAQARELISRGRRTAAPVRVSESAIEIEAKRL